MSKKISIKSSEDNLLGKPPPGDKNLGIETVVRFHAIEDCDKTEEGEEA